MAEDTETVRPAPITTQRRGPCFTWNTVVREASSLRLRSTTRAQSVSRETVRGRSQGPRWALSASVSPEVEGERADPRPQPFRQQWPGTSPRARSDRTCCCRTPPPAGPATAPQGQCNCAGRGLRRRTGRGAAPVPRSVLCRCRARHCDQHHPPAGRLLHDSATQGLPVLVAGRRWRTHCVPAALPAESPQAASRPISDKR